MQWQQKRALLSEEAKRLASACNRVELRQAGMQALRAIGVVPGYMLCLPPPLLCQLEMTGRLDLDGRLLSERGEIEDGLMRSESMRFELAASKNPCFKFPALSIVNVHFLT